MKKKETRKKSSALVKRNENGVEQSYSAWIVDIKRRYRATQIKAAIAVNSALIEFYWNLGKDVREKYVDTTRNTIAFSQNTILKNLACQWASPIMSLRKYFPPRRSWQSACPTPRSIWQWQRKSASNDRNI